MPETLVTAENLSKKFCRDLKRSLWYGVKDIASEMLGRRNNDSELRPKEFWALKDISFELKRGEALGLIGRNGAGKTTLLKILNGLIKPDTGKVTMKGRVGAFIALGAGFNPILTGRENIYVNGAVLGLSKKEIDGKFDEIVDFADLRDFIDTPVQSYSSGMHVRLGFAIAAHCEPDILLVDEILAVGDDQFRRKCIDHMTKIVPNVGLIYVSHNLRSIEQVCQQGILLDRGNMIAVSKSSDVIAEYMKRSYIESENNASQSRIATHREGSGEIRYLNVSIASENGSNGKVVQSGSTLVVRANFQCFMRMKNTVRFRVGIEDLATRTLVTMASCDFNDASDDGEIECIFPNLSFRPRTYGLYLSITDLCVLIDRWSPALRFSVIDRFNLERMYSVGDGELLYWPNEITVTIGKNSETHRYPP